jgi:ATP-dependent Clp protease protease subunit
MKNAAFKGLRMVARADKTADVYVYGTIGGDWFGDGITAKAFADQLKALGAVTSINVHINSEGGDVFDGRTIHTLLKSHAAKVVVKVDGLAASAASLIAMAGDEIEMADGSFLMIHNAWTVAMGGANDLRKTADILDQINATMVSTYAGRSKKQPGDIKKMMDAETWMEASDAVAMGFADRVTGALRMAACVSDPSKFRNLPAALYPKRAAALSVIDGMKNPATRR